MKPAKLQLKHSIVAVTGMLGGAAIGGAAGASEASRKREEIVVECTKQRGHCVVG
ncbi:MAG: hypothetical protein ABJH07_09765 [Sedimentitalea sp.]|uniref:hypothetical protein n=1 Tax=Sedimentitalea sp. TaxID=2048915 RepID=UPI00326540DF